MQLHPSTFEYLKPTDQQVEDMQQSRKAFKEFAGELDELIPDGPDKTFIMRKLRDVAMWVNVAITRQSDGGPRI